MVRAIFAVPYRAADERRRELSDFVNWWISTHHLSWPAYEGESPDGPFNRGAAINNAVQRGEDSAWGCDWQVVIVHDADNICDPDTLREAVDLAHDTGKVVFPFETYTYLDEYTSNRLMRQGNWFIAPELHPTEVFRTTVRHKHYSGIQVIPRSTYEAVGGYIELTGWGAEDAIMNTVFETFSPGVQWLPGGAYHLWHPANRNNPRDQDNVRNHRIWSKVQAISRRKRPDELRNYLAAAAGYHIP